MPPGVAMGMGHNDSADMNKDVEFISEQQPIEVYTGLYFIYICITIVR